MKTVMSRKKFHVKRGDVVQVIAGDEAGSRKTGKVLQVIPAKEAAIVEGLNLVKKCMRKSEDKPQGGIVEKEAPIALSNLRVIEAVERKGGKAGRTKKKGSGK